MKMIKLIAGAAFAGSLLSTSVSAYTEKPSAWPQAPRAGVPTVAKVVSPTKVPQRYEGSTVDVEFTVDPTGQPRNIRILAPSDPDLARQLIPAVAQWRFAPAEKNGAPVATRVVLPIKLI